MADSASPHETTSGSVFSLEDIDKIIETEDPSFKEELNEIQKQSVEGSESIDNLKVEPETDTENGKDEDEHPSPAKKFLRILLKPWTILQNFIRMRIIRMKNRMVMSVDRSIHFVRHELPDRIRYSWSRLKDAVGWLKSQWNAFRSFNQTQKLALLFMVLASIASLFFFVKTFSGHWLPQYEDNLPRSLAQGAPFVGEVKSKSELQDLFQAFPRVEYYVLLHKVIVNLKPSWGSGQNPMGAFQIFVGVDSQDTAIEIKDREQEILDLVQQTFETFTYNQAASVIGKERIKETLRDRINKILNQGRVFNIYFNNIILYSGN